MFDTGVLDEQEVKVKKVVSTTEVTTKSATTTTIDELTFAQTLIEIKAAKPKVRGVMIQEPSEFTTTTTTTTPAASKPSHDKGKAKMIESEESLKMKQKDQLLFDEQEAIMLQAQFDEEERIAREKEEANAALITQWNDIQDKVETDYELAQRLQAEELEELTIEEKSKLFQQLLKKIRKHFAAKRAEERRSKPPTKAQQRSIITTYLKNIAGWKHKDLKNKSFASVQELFENAMKRLVTEEDVAIDAIPLATKPAPIFDREDLENLWKLVKAKHGNTRQEEGYEKVLWGDLKTMFEHHIEDLIWRNLQGKKVLLWRLYDSYGVHFVRFEDMHVYMLVEKIYPLTPTTITDMLNKKLKSDYWNEMCYQLLKLMTKQLKNPRSGRIVGIKSFIRLFGITVALIKVSATQEERFNVAGVKVTAASVQS
ncbi:hypothetical protein Tco_0015680 [Tanacetum coccineum]